MQNYVGREVKNALKSVTIEQGTSKEGTVYQYVSLRLINGFEKRVYFNNAEQFALTNALELLQTQQQVDANAF